MAAVLPWLASGEDERQSRRLRVGAAAALAVHVTLLGMPLAGEREAPRVLRPVARFVLAPTPDFRPRERPPVPPEPRPVDRPATAPRVVPVPALSAPEPIDRPSETPEPWPAPIPDSVADPIAIPDSPPDDPDRVLEFGAGMTRPVRISGADPAYPEAARRTKTQGTVVVEATIDREGRVVRTQVVLGLPFGLSESAVRAVEGWAFTPATVAGEPIAVRYRVQVRFSLR